MLNLALEPLFNAQRGCEKLAAIHTLLAAVLQRAERYAWPGNVHELENRAGWVLAWQSHVCDTQGAVDVARRSKGLPEYADPLALAVPAAAAQPPLKKSATKLNTSGCAKY